MFCCKDARDARLAVISSFAGQGVTLLVMLVGVGLFAYYAKHPLSGTDLELYRKQGDTIFPLFIIQVIPAGLTGLIIAGIFAAAISSLDSILSALSQTSMASLYLPLREKMLAKTGTTLDDPLEQRRQVRASRILVIFWGVVLSFAALYIDNAVAFFPSLLDLALALAGYTSGGLLAGFMLSFLPLRVNGYGFLFSAPLSVLFVFSLKWHCDPLPWTMWVVMVGGGMLLLLWTVFGIVRDMRPVALVLRFLLLEVAVVATLWINLYGTFERIGANGKVEQLSISWPWFAPAGFLIAFLLGWLLAERKESCS
ncbi:MAG: hypothetical protein V2A76_14830, partial [Planctomycetota bacterium]